MNNEKLPRVDVLMATYNGAPFLAAQIESILAQTGADIRLVVRDDGSTDATREILAAHAARHPGRIVIVSDALGNLGVCMNFLTLLSRPSDARYFAFSDQDDVWLADKIAAGVTAMRGRPDTPRLYFSAVEFVTEDLRHIGISRQTIRPSYESALVEGAMAGCTAILNAPLRDLVAARMPARATIHDWWVYLVACALGDVIFDPVPRIRYRQHGNNLIGGGQGSLQKWRRHLARLRNRQHWPIAGQAAELLRLHGGVLNGDQRQLAEALVAGKQNLRTRLRLALGGRIKAQTAVGTLGIRAMILANRY